MRADYLISFFRETGLPNLFFLVMRFARRVPPGVSLRG
jgi:hypothetical protein